MSSADALTTTNCPICLNQLVPPVKVLKCGHSFCTPCVTALFVNSRNVPGANNKRQVRVVCPSCRSVTLLPKTKLVSSLPTNYALNQILQEQQRQAAEFHTEQRDDVVRLDENIDRIGEQRQERVTGEIVNDEIDDENQSAGDIDDNPDDDDDDGLIWEFFDSDVTSHYETVVERAKLLEAGSSEQENANYSIWYCTNDWCGTANYEFRTKCRLCLEERSLSLESGTFNFSNANGV